jgi:hypothetical protein
LLTALKRPPTERYDSAAALADDLERYLAGSRSGAQPDSPHLSPEEVRRSQRRLPVAAASAIVVSSASGWASRCGKAMKRAFRRSVPPHSIPLYSA